eukprot:Skav225176  [mRNA]  locus=scaffold1095:361532:363368:- [translate_table: standard]
MLSSRVDQFTMSKGFKHSCEFTVDGNFIPRIIGKGGETIRAGADRVVRIFGNSAMSVASARAEVEYVEEALPAAPRAMEDRRSCSNEGDATGRGSIPLARK